MNHKQPDPLRSLMQKAELELVSDHFEDHLMHLIELEPAGSLKVSRDQKLSSVFFFIGILLGFFLNTLIKYMPLEDFDIPRETATLVFQMVFVFLVLIQFDKNKAVLRQWFWQASEK